MNIYFTLQSICTRCVRVIVAGNGPVDASSNLVCFSHNANTLEKSMHRSILSQVADI